MDDAGGVAWSESCGGSGVGLVDSNLDEARRRLIELGDIIKAAVAVRNSAGKVVTGLESLQGTLTLTIDQACAALTGLLSSDAASPAA